MQIQTRIVLKWKTYKISKIEVCIFILKTFQNDSWDSTSSVKDTNFSYRATLSLN